MHDPASSMLSPPLPSNPWRKKSRSTAFCAPSTPEKFSSQYATTLLGSLGFSSISTTRRMGTTMRLMPAYLSMKWNALGTWLSPRWMRSDPTHSPSSRFVSASTCDSALYSVGAGCTRWRPCPVFLSSYGVLSSSRSCSAIIQSSYMREQMFFHSVSDCSTKWYCFACSCVSREPPSSSRIARLDAVLRGVSGEKCSRKRSASFFVLSTFASAKSFWSLSDRTISSTSSGVHLVVDFTAHSLQKSETRRSL
mmetsp:Transcript_31611/g.97690  ORF Transcript_31611/g.97690 Transcript_31611/m.97690 type:complete len:251 (-) Transcript_31611:722-1474(-)